MDKTKFYVISDKPAFIRRTETANKGDLGRAIMHDLFFVTDWYFELVGITSIRTSDHVVVYESMIKKTNVAALVEAASTQEVV
jgi:hypothetical protein